MLASLELSLSSNTTMLFLCHLPLFLEENLPSGSGAWNALLTAVSLSLGGASTGIVRKGERGPLCPSSHNPRSRWPSHRGPQGHCGLSLYSVHLLQPLCSLLTFTGCHPKQWVPEMPRLGSICRIKGRETRSRPKLLVLGLRAKAQPCFF